MSTKGTIKIAGLAKPEATNYKIDVNLSSAAAGNQKPQFDLVGSFAPPQKFLGHNWYFNPNSSVDLGLGASKSKNSILLNLPFRRGFFPYLFKCYPKRLQAPGLNGSNKLTENNEVVNLPNYYEWKNTCPSYLESIEFKAGPKFEMDRKFARINAVGTVRFDFNFVSWQQSIAKKRENLEDDLITTDYKPEDVSIKTGFILIPRIAFDFGRKLTAEVIENKDKHLRTVIPRHPIFRSYVGFTNTYELNFWVLPMTLTIDEDLMYLGYTETIGNKSDDGIDIRKVRGFHHYGKAALDIAFDPAKHYNFSVTYENGRSAPNFEYLNKVSAGIRLVY